MARSPQYPEDANYASHWCGTGDRVSPVDGLRPIVTGSPKLMVSRSIVVWNSHWEGRRRSTTSPLPIILSTCHIFPRFFDDFSYQGEMAPRSFQDPQPASDGHSFLVASLEQRLPSQSVKLRCPRLPSACFTTALFTSPLSWLFLAQVLTVA